MSRLSCRFSSYVIGLALSSSSLSKPCSGGNDAVDDLARRCGADLLLPPRRDADVAAPLPRPATAPGVAMVPAAVNGRVLWVAAGVYE